NEITLGDDLPLLLPAERLLSSRCLATQEGNKYFSRVYRGEPNHTVWKQTTRGLALHEAKILGALDSRYFPHVISARQEEAFSCAVLEWIEGKNLTQAIPEVATTPKSLAQFLLECLDLLAA